ncbi:MAG: preprotein translocase subunit YajC, partial [Campylobacter sp.]
MEQPSLLGTFFPFIVLFALIYFLFILPQQKQTKAHKATVDSL